MLADAGLPKTQQDRDYIRIDKSGPQVAAVIPAPA